MAWTLVFWAAGVLAVFGLPAALLFLWTRSTVRREPYKSFLALRTRNKLRFFRAVLKDPRIPLYVKAIPVVTVLYLLSPIDIVPDFIPILGYLDDVGIVMLALSMVISLSPRPVIDELLRDAGSA